MKKFFLSLVASLAVFTALGQSRIVTESIQSRFLGCEQNYNVYLPDAYDASRSYPVIYLLHGLWGNYTDWVSAGGMKAVADELILTGELVPAVIVMPNAGDQDVHNYQNGYFNVKDWPYEDFFFQEFLPAVEKKYHCGGSKGSRAIMGLSMGGGGCMKIGLAHPENYAAIGCLSAGISPVWTSAKPDPRNAWRAAMVTGGKDLAGTEEDAFSSARRILSEGKPIPRIYHAWGSEDFVRTSARTTRDFFLQMPGNPFGYVWQEHPGMHTWEFWDEHIQTFLEFTGLSRVDDVKN